MASSGYEFLLPRVTEDDLLSLVFQDVTDPVHTGLWEQLAATNPLLARELLKRAYAAAPGLSTRESGPSSSEIQKMMLDLAAFAVGALTIAAQRETEKAADPNVGDGVEYQQPLA